MYFGGYRIVLDLRKRFETWNYLVKCLSHQSWLMQCSFIATIILCFHCRGVLHRTVRSFLSHSPSQTFQKPLWICKRTSSNAYLRGPKARKSMKFASGDLTGISLNFRNFPFYSIHKLFLSFDINNSTLCTA